MGQPAARLDGLVESDSAHYFDPVGRLWQYYPAFAPADVIQFRTVPFLGEPAAPYSCMLWLHPQSADIAAGTIVGGGMRNMSVTSGGARMATVLWGHLLYGRFEGLSIDKGATALASMSLGANYPITIKGCTLGGYDGCIFLDTSIATISGININRPGRVPFRFAESALCDCPMCLWLAMELQNGSSKSTPVTTEDSTSSPTSGRTGKME